MAEGGIGMAKYRTRQREILLAYFQEHADTVLTAREIAEALREQGVSVSAVYRNLSDLESEGRIESVEMTGSREAHYLFTDAPECEAHLHLFCRQCGKAYHMDAACMEPVTRMAKKDGFAIDPESTVLYGVCGACRRGR